ncbi:MAG TPA: transglutaminaseTgpA domain-containing protein [Propionibacteriaceae bacterium]
MRSSDRSGLAIIVAVLLASLTVTPLTSDLGFLGLAALLVLLVGGMTIGLRRARLGNGTVISAQLLLVLVFSLVVSLSMPGVGEPWYDHYPSLWSAGIEHMRTQASPMDPNDGVTLIFVTVIGLIMVMTDLLVEGIGRPAWAIAPPATLFLVPALGLGTDTGVLSFLCIAVGYLAILVAEGLNTTARWTRGLSRDSAEGLGQAAPVVWRAAGILAAPAVVGALVLGLALPTLMIPGFGLGNGSGGNGPLQLTDPTLDLRRNLNQPNDKQVIEYQSDAPGGVYLRLATLPQLSAAGWTSVQIRLNSGDNLPAIPGLGNEPDQRRKTTISVLDFGSQYLPLPYAPRSFQAAGDWRYDANSLVVVNASNEAQDLRNLTYTVESVDIAPTAEALDSAAAGTPTDASTTAAIPSDLPQTLVDLTESVIKDARTPAAKAAAIQAYLRSSEFTYSTERLPGSGYEALENFLIRDRTGYCEQFASSMAMMARVAGIPSRVSVGFLPGSRDGDSWRVSIRDMHAWPELYFAGYGWVRFEPTPASVTGSAPAWTVPNATDDENSPSARPSATPTPSATAPTTDPNTVPTEQTPTQDTSAGFPWGKTLLGSAGALLVLLILAAPATIRVRRRNARFSGDAMPDAQVEAAWAEIRDTVLDYGGSWPEGSPHSIGVEIGDRLEPDESQSMGQVATLVERARYARTLGDDRSTEDLNQITADVRRGIAAPSGPIRKALVFMLPRSVLRRTPRDAG